MVEKKIEYELRELRSTDVFLMFKIIKKIGFNEVKSCFASEAVRAALSDMNTPDMNAQADASETKVVSLKKKNGEALKTIGVEVTFELVNVLIDHLPDVENDIYNFLAQLSGMKKEDIATLPMVTFTEMLIDVFRKEEFKDFITVVSRLFK